MTATNILDTVAPVLWHVTKCGVCGSSNLEPVLDLGTSPPPCVMHPVGARPDIEAHYPLTLLRCADCTLVQLSVVVDPEFVFAADFPYSSGNSPQLQQHFQEVADSLGTLGERDLVVDIGANDGTLLSKFEGCRTLGVEPTCQADKIQGDYVKAFFDEELADWIVSEYGQAKVITACNVLAHVADLESVMRGIKKLLAPDGVFVAENHDVGSVLAGQWDMVYHEHLRYFSPHSFARLLASHGLLCESWKPIDTHGGSFRMVAQDRMAGLMPPIVDEDWAGLRSLASRQRTLLRRVLAAQGPVVGIGAAARATTFVNYIGLDVEDIECVYEVSGSDKIGKLIPGTGIPVVDESGLYETGRPAVMLSWHLADLVVPKLRDRGYQGTVIVPLPTLHYRLT